MAVIVKDEGVTLGQLALGVTQLKVDREVYAEGVANEIGRRRPGAFATMPTFNLRVDGEVATIKHWDASETPRVELIVDVGYGQTCFWIELWTYLYVMEQGQLLPLDSERSRTLALDIRGHVPLHEEFLELLTSEEVIAYLEDVGPEMIRQMGRSLALMELSH